MRDRAGGVWVGCRNRDLVNARLRGLGREDGNNGDGDGRAGSGRSRCALLATPTELVRDGEAILLRCRARPVPDVSLTYLPPLHARTMFTESGGCNLDQLTGAGAAVKLAAGDRVRPWAIGGVLFAGKKDSTLQPVDGVPSLSPPKVAKFCRKLRWVQSRCHAGVNVTRRRRPR